MTSSVLKVGDLAAFDTPGGMQIFLPKKGVTHTGAAIAFDTTERNERYEAIADMMIDLAETASALAHTKTGPSVAPLASLHS